MAVKEFNVDLDIKGKVSATNVPNSTGSIVTWNTTSKVFGFRTNAQIISDLNLSSSFVPYTGATANVDLGSRSITSTGGFIGNASTTTTLATARTINGTPFNGSDNITTANWGTARNITIGDTTKSVNGSGNVAWSLSEIGASSVSHTHPISDIVGLQTELNKIGNLPSLTTTNKTSLVGAVNEVNNIQIGGRNLLLNSKLLEGRTDVWGGLTSTVIPLSIKLDKDKEYIFTYKNNNDIPRAEINTITLRNANDETIQEIQTIGDGSPTIFKVTTVGVVSIAFYSVWKNAFFSFGELMLTSGNKIVDWTPAIEDQVSDWNETDSTKHSFIKNKPTIPTVNNGQLTLSTGTGLSGSANFTANQAGGSTFSVAVASTHKLPTITEWNAALANTTYTAGNGLTLSGTAFSVNYGTSAGTSAQGDDARINNGQTAYGWGNHASAGYLTPTSLSNYYQSGDVNIPAKGGDYRVFPYAGNSANFDWNEKTGLGFYKDTFDAGDVATYNAPKSGFYGYVENLRYSISDNLTQYAHPYRVTDGKWIRSKFNGIWTPWVEFIHTGNLDTNVSALGFIKSSALPTVNTYTGSNGINVAGTVISPTYGTAAGTIAQGNDTRINNGQTAFNSLGNYVLRTNLNNRLGLLSSVTGGSDFYYSPSTDPDKPTGVQDGVFMSMSFDSDNWYSQLYADWRNNEWYVRTKNSGTWNSFQKLIHTGNISSELSGYVPTSRTITINGVTQNLSANRTWTVPDTVTSLRGTESGIYTSGDITLLAGANTTITQSGANITIASTDTITAQAFYESSLRKYKTNIKSYKESALEVLKNIEIVTFDRTDSDIKNKIGIIADDSPSEILNEEHDAVDLYKTIFIQAKAIQELSEEVVKLKEINNALEKRLTKIEKLLNL